jgi:predicted Zn-dependent protease
MYPPSSDSAVLWQALDAAHYHFQLILPQLGRTPDDAGLHFQAGTILLQLGKQDMAHEALAHALRLQPNHRATHRLLAAYYAERGEPERARDHQQRAAIP